MDEALIDKASAIAKRLRTYDDENLGVPVADDGAEVIDELIQYIYELQDDYSSNIAIIEKAVESVKRIYR